MEFINQAICWMRLPENASLAGWAQGVGALFGMAFAIGVPAYQRHTQVLDMRRKTANLNLVLASSCSFLLGDVVNFLNGLVIRAKLARSSCRDDVQVGDLLERIRALETREISQARIISLYSARAALITVNGTLHDPTWEQFPLQENELRHLKIAIAGVEERHALADFDADFSLAREHSVQKMWPVRPIAGAILTCLAFFSHPLISIKHRLFGTK